MSTNRVPHSVEKPAIIEGLFQVQFSSKTPNIDTILPGIFFSELAGSVQSPAKLMPDLPLQVRSAIPNFTYQPTIGLTGDGYVVSLGERTMLLTVGRPYRGWNFFGQLIDKHLKILMSTKLVDVVERCSIKYVNVFESDPGDTAKWFNAVNAHAQLGPYDLINRLTHFRTEIVEDDITTIVELQPGVKAETPKKEIFQGLLLSIDSIRFSPRDFWENARHHVEALHGKAKVVFFNLITEETLQRLGPVWEETQ